MAAQILYRAAPAAFVLLSVASAQIPSSLQQLEAFNLRPWIAEAVVQAQQHHGRKPLTAFSPRMTSHGVLTGTEGITIESFRAAVRAGNHYTGFASHQSILNELENILSPSDEVIVFNFASYVLGWTHLRSNWVRATLLNDSESARLFALDALETEQAFRDSAATLGFNALGFPTGWSEVEIRVTTLAVGTLMLGAVSTLQSEATYLSNSLDPEGYLRQHLLHTAETVRLSRELILDLGEVAIAVNFFLRESGITLPPPPPTGPPPPPPTVP